MTEHANSRSSSSSGGGGGGGSRASAASAAGIVDDPDRKARVIPESRRADGSVRKERRVKPGFVPAEDVAHFVPSHRRRAEQAAEQRKSGVPGSAVPISIARSTANTLSSASPAANSKQSTILAERATGKTTGTASPSASVKAQPSSSRSATGSPSRPAWEGPRARARREAEESASKDIPDAWDDDGRSAADATTAKSTSHRIDDTSSIDNVTASLDSLQIKPKGSER